MKADLDIYATVKRNVLVVPKDFIFSEGGVQQVYILDNGKKKPVVVLTGVEWSEQVEVKEGLANGDQIVKLGW